jgi:hypothetical protein
VVEYLKSKKGNLKLIYMKMKPNYTTVDVS